MIVVRHGGGGDVQAGESVLGFRNYEQGREKFQAETLDFVWLDEEPPHDIYMEAITRTNTTLGPVYMTFTPLMGMSATVKRFLIDKHTGTVVVFMGIYDAEHSTREQADAILASYPDHEREARAYGKPVLGSGAVFPVPESSIIVPPFNIPDSWPRICGLDLGGITRRPHPGWRTTSTRTSSTCTTSTRPSSSRFPCTPAPSRAAAAGSRWPGPRRPAGAERHWHTDARRLPGRGRVHAAGAHAVRGRLQWRRGRHPNHAQPHGLWPVQGVFAPGTLAFRVPHLPPQGWRHREDRRRRHLRIPLWRDVPSLRGSQHADQLQTTQETWRA